MRLPKPLPDRPTDWQPTEGRDGQSNAKPKLPLKPIAYLALAAAALASLVLVLRPAPLPVEVARVERGPLPVSVEAEGKTRLRDRFVVSAPVDGRLARIELEEGDTVEEGQVVARLDPLPLTASVREALGRLAQWRSEREGVATLRPKPEALSQARLRIQAAEAERREAEARVAQARAEREQARRDRLRAQQLQAEGALSQQERERAELAEIARTKDLEAARLAAKAAAANLAVAEEALALLQAERQDPDYLLKVYDARIASVEAELAKLRDEAARTDIPAPIQGQVLRVLQESAQFVTAGTPLLELGDVSQLELVIDVLSSDAEQVAPGNAILISQAGEERPLRGRVQRLEPSAFTKISALGVEEQRVNVIGELIDTSHPFGDAYRIDVKIIVWEGKEVLKVPTSALFRCGKSWCAFTVEGGRARRRSLEVGRRGNFETEIRAGLQAGDLVVLYPSEKIEPGSRVEGKEKPRE